MAVGWWREAMLHKSLHRPELMILMGQTKASSINCCSSLATIAERSHGEHFLYVLNCFYLRGAQQCFEWFHDVASECWWRIFLVKIRVSQWQCDSRTSPREHSSFEKALQQVYMFYVLLYLRSLSPFHITFSWMRRRVDLYFNRVCRLCRVHKWTVVTPLKFAGFKCSSQNVACSLMSWNIGPFEEHRHPFVTAICLLMHSVRLTCGQKRKPSCFPIPKCSARCLLPLAYRLGTCPSGNSPSARRSTTLLERRLSVISASSCL